MTRSDASKGKDSSSRQSSSPTSPTSATAGSGFRPIPAHKLYTLVSDTFASGGNSNSGAISDVKTVAADPQGRFVWAIGADGKPHRAGRAPEAALAASIMSKNRTALPDGDSADGGRQAAHVGSG